MFKQKFTLEDLFSNPDLKDYLPQFKITEKKAEDSGLQFDTAYKVNKANIIPMIKNYARLGASPFYDKVKVVGQNEIIVSGKLKRNSTIQEAYDSVLRALQTNAYNLSFTTQNGNIIRSMLDKTINGKKFRNGYMPKLYLKINSLEEIKSLDRMERAKLMKNVMENIYFSDDFKPYREPSMEKGTFISNARNTLRDYASLKQEFDRKVGVK